MGTFNGYTAEHLLQIENTTVVGGSVNEIGNLMLATREGLQLDAGRVKGDTGVIGPDRPLVAGMIQAFGGTTPPAGWLFCDGAAISRTTYSQLFTAIGTTYGVGDNSTTFNLPNLKGRTPVGFDATQTEFDNLGETGGEKAHTLTTPEMPSHTHIVKGYSGVDDSNFTGLNGAFAAADAVTPFDQNTQATGGGLPHNNLQPYNTVHFIISIGDGTVTGTDPEAYIGRGTSAQRDAIFGVPATDPSRVALANRKIIWFNTDLGWEESYYATTGKAGLVVIGLVANASSGWYPTGRGPAMCWEGNAQVTPAANTFLAGWGWTRKRGGAAWWLSSDGLQVSIQRFGRYEVRGWTTQATGSVNMNWHLRVTGPDKIAVVKNVDGNAFPQMASLYTRAHMEIDDVILEPNQNVGMFTTNGGAVCHVGGTPPGQLSIRYLGPPLVLE